MKKSVISLCACGALLIVALIGGTLAYFNDVETSTNTFTFGDNVGISLIENSDPDPTSGFATGTPNPTNNGFDYDVVPGMKYAKKPVVTVDADSLDAYVFGEIVVDHYNELYAALSAAGEDPTKLDKLLVNADLGTGEVVDAWMEGDAFHIVYTKGKMSASDSWTMFEAVEIPATLTGENIEAFANEIVSMTINAYAVQAEGIDTVADAWAAVDPAA